MTREEKIAIADMVRSRDRFGPVSPEELAALPGKEKELWVHTKNGKTVHVFEERPDNLPEQAALLLNFHGGGFLKGRTDRDRRYCCWVMEQLNCMVWDVDYSLAPEAPFPVIPPADMINARNRAKAFLYFIRNLASHSIIIIYCTKCRIIPKNVWQPWHLRL